MRFVMFYHSLVSDWNHGNAHFLRGIATELLRRGHDVRVYEPENGWSRRNLLSQHGDQSIRDFEEIYPQLHTFTYEGLDVDSALEDADVLIVHEWNPPELIERLARKPRNYQVYFH